MQSNKKISMADQLAPVLYQTFSQVLNSTDVEWRKKEMLAPVNSLIKMKANVNYAEGKEKNTTLHLASQLKDGSQYVKLLLENKADANAQNENGTLAVQLADRASNFETILCFLQGNYISEKNKPNVFAHLLWDTLFKYKQNPQLALLIAQLTILECDLSTWYHMPNQPCSYHIHLAAENATLDTVRLLLERKVDPNLLTEDGQSPLHKALQRYKTKDTWSRRDATALQIATLLVDYKADVNLADKEGNTPLHLALAIDATDENYKALLHKLLYKGADETVTNNAGKTAMQVIPNFPNPSSNLTLFMDTVLKVKEELKPLHTERQALVTLSPLFRERHSEPVADNKGPATKKLGENVFSIVQQFTCGKTVSKESVPTAQYFKAYFGDLDKRLSDVRAKAVSEKTSTSNALASRGPA